MPDHFGQIPTPPSPPAPAAGSPSTISPPQPENQTAAGAGDRLGGMFKSLMGSVESGWGQVRNAFSGINTNNVGTTIGGVANGVGTTLTGWWNTISDGITRSGFQGGSLMGGLLGAGLAWVAGSALGAGSLFSGGIFNAILSVFTLMLIPAGFMMGSNWGAGSLSGIFGGTAHAATLPARGNGHAQGPAVEQRQVAATSLSSQYVTSYGGPATVPPSLPATTAQHVFDAGLAARLSPSVTYIQGGNISPFEVQRSPIPPIINEGTTRGNAVGGG